MKKQWISSKFWVGFWLVCSFVVAVIAWSALKWGTHVLRHLSDTCAHSSCSPHQYLYLSLKDIGPAIGGFLVLSAAFGAAATAAWTFATEAKRDASEKLELKQAAIQVVEAEIRSFWGRVEYLKLPAKLSDAIKVSGPFAKEFKAQSTSAERKSEIAKKAYRLVRRSMGQDWFVFFRSHPLELSRLSEIHGDYVSLSIVARNLVSRFDYINQADESKHPFIFWHEEHERVLSSLTEIHKSSNAILSKLNLQSVDVIPEASGQENPAEAFK